MKKKTPNLRIFHYIGIILVIIILVISLNRIFRTGDIGETPKLEPAAEEETVDVYAEYRQSMVKNQLMNRDITDEKVLEVMGKVERHRFVPKHLIGQAYEDHPVPIGHGQTISQPYIVALMTQSLEVEEDYKVLEIGTGSGYQAAVLAELVEEVYTIEIIEELAESAEQRLKSLGYDNVEVKHGDGYYGWEEHAPFDAVIITAAANHVPPPLLQQLKDGGKLIIPLGSTLTFQTLTLITKKGADMETEVITGVRFVPMTGKAQE